MLLAFVTWHCASAAYKLVSEPSEVSGSSACSCQNDDFALWRTFQSNYSSDWQWLQLYCSHGYNLDLYLSISIMRSIVTSVGSQGGASSKKTAGML